MPHVVDTVALIRYLENAPSMGANAAAVLADPNAQLVFPAIVLAEAGYIIVKKRIPLNFSMIVQAITSDPRCAIHPLDLEVVLATPPPPALEMHDGMVVATAAVVAAKMKLPIADVPILTCDGNIRTYGAPVVW